MPLNDDEAFRRRDQMLLSGYDEKDEEEIVCPDCGSDDIRVNNLNEYECQDCGETWD